MTPDEETCSMQSITFCRHFNRRMMQEQARIGARVEDIAIGSIYAAVDIAQEHTGDTVSAIAWARAALDMLENGILIAETVQ